MIISVDGIDKTGKCQIINYLKILGKCKYILIDRGLISNIAFSNMFNRNYEYNLDEFKNMKFIYLTCEKEDWEVRCKLTNEPKISYEENIIAFNNVVKNLKSKGFLISEYNTTYMTPYQIAKDFLSKIET